MKEVTRKKRGFTLVEVTLAIVVGIILVAGATLIYNQARQSAGNSRANEKVMALQTVVEEFAAMNGGLYPDKVGYVQGMWLRRRPDDFNKSPWGGQIGPTFAPATGVVTVDALWAFQANGINAGGDAGPLTGTFPETGMPESTALNNNLSGGLVYLYNGSNTLPFAKDLRTNQTITTRAMAIFVCDQQGRYPNFVVGGRNN